MKASNDIENKIDRGTGQETENTTNPIIIYTKGRNWICFVYNEN